MTLPSTGTLSLSQVNVELGRSPTASINLNEEAVRTLAGVSSGSIAFGNLRGKSAWSISLSPSGGQSAGGLSSFYNFSYSCIGAPSGATFNWTVVGDGNAVWSVYSGQTTSTGVIRVASAVFGELTQATITCTVTSNGGSKSASGEAVYLRD